MLRHAAPVLGEHTRLILQTELGYTNEQFDKLLRDKIIQQFNLLFAYLFLLHEKQIYKIENQTSDQQKYLMPRILYFFYIYISHTCHFVKYRILEHLFRRFDHQNPIAFDIVNFYRSMYLKSCSRFRKLRQFSIQGKMKKDFIFFVCFIKFP